MPTLDCFTLGRSLQICLGNIDNQQIRVYFRDLVTAIWNTLYRGEFFECEGLFNELRQITHIYGIRSGYQQLFLLECEFWIKRKKPDRLNRVRQQLVESLQNSKQDYSDLIKRYNSLALFDQKLELIGEDQGQIATIIKMSDQGNISSAIGALKPIMETSNELKHIKMILLGKLYLLQSSMNALDCFSKTAKCQLAYESYMAKILFVSGFKTMCKLDLNPEDWALDFSEFVSYLESHGNAKMDKQIQDFQMIHRQIKCTPNLNQQLMLAEQAAKLCSSLPCYSSPSLTGLDLYLLCASNLIQLNRLSEAKQLVSKCKGIAESIGVYSGSRRSRINHRLALIYEKQNRIGEALDLVKTSMQQQHNQKRLESLRKTMRRLQGRVRQEIDGGVITEHLNQEESEGDHSQTRVRRIDSFPVDPVEIISPTLIKKTEVPPADFSRTYPPVSQPPKSDSKAICCLLF